MEEMRYPGKTIDGYKVFSYADAKEFYNNALEIIIAVGEPAVRKILFDKIKKDGIDMPVLINPSSYVSPNAVIGEGKEG